MSLRRIIWLASYPKSGNTWLRTVLANYFLGRRKAVGINELRRFTRADVRADFYHAAAGGQYRGTTLEECLRVRPAALRLIAAEREGTHFVKTHTRIDRVAGVTLIPPELTAAAVYVMRNPFDVVSSFARHNGQTVDETIRVMTDPHMVTGSPAGVFEVLGRWDEHIASWVDAPGLPIHVIRYEDMHADARRTVEGLLRFMQVTPNTAHLKRVLAATAFDKLRAQEDREGFVERPETLERFFHSGRAGGWREALSDAQVARLHEAFEPALRRWYPELVEETAAIAGRAGA